MLGNAVFLALREIRANVLRSTLTALGIIIGVAAVITMVTLGAGATQRVTAEIESLGRNLVIVAPFFQQRAGGPATPARSFDAADVTAIEREVPGVGAVAAVNQRGVVAVFDTENHSLTATGVTAEYFTVREWALAEGRIFTEADQQAGRPVCILGQTPKRELFGALPAIGQTIRVGNVACEVIGLLTEKGQSTFGQDQDDVLFMPLRTMQRRIAGNRNINGIWVSARTPELVEEVAADITTLMRERRRIAPGQDDDFVVRQAQEIASLLGTITGVLTALLAAIAGVSLLVGGIGIMNIMLVSVTERTREIGIRLAIGALERDVLMQFLVEAMMLSIFGGVLGMLLGLGLSALGALALGVPFVFQPMVIVLAFVFSAAVGIGFGFFPARRAARLDPIEALRYE